MNETAKEAARRFSATKLSEGFLPVALHEYVNADGCTLHYRIRLKHPETGEKWIRPMRLNGSGFELGEPKYPHGKPLYALHPIASNPDAVVWIVEGEQKADALNKLGLVATTSGGATSAGATDWQPLQGRTLTIWPDNDEPGRSYAGEVASILLGMGCTVSCVDVAKVGLAHGDDVMQWLEAHPGAGRADVEALPVFTPSASAKSAAAGLVVVGLHEFLENDLPAREEILSPWLLSQSLNMVYSWRGVGKTHCSLGIAFAIASGTSFLGWKAAKARKVLFIDGEMPGVALQTRLAAIVAASDDQPAPGMLRILTPDLQSGPMPDLATQAGQEAINDILEDVEVIVLDNLSCLARGCGRENQSETWLVVAQWALCMRAQGRSVLFLHHAGKDGQQRGTSKREDLLDCVISLKRPVDYNPADGAVFEIHYEKSRAMFGKDTDPIEAKLTTDANGLQAWTMRPVSSSNFDRVVSLANEGLSQVEISTELELSRSAISRAVRKGVEEGKITHIANRKGRNQHTKSWHDKDD